MRSGSYVDLGTPLLFWLGSFFLGGSGKDTSYSDSKVLERGDWLCVSGESNGKLELGELEFNGEPGSEIE